jgi:hypothetical protein
VEILRVTVDEIAPTMDRKCMGQNISGYCNRGYCITDRFIDAE